MAYIKTTWVNDETDVDATNMNHIEDGIEELDLNKVDATSLEGHLVNVGNEVDTDYKVNFIKGKNLFDKNIATLNSYVKYSDGTIASLSGYFVSDFIEVKPNTTYYWNDTQLRGNAGAFYNSNKTYISGISSTDLGTYYFTTPSDAKYVRVNGVLNDIVDYQLEEGETATTYEPYVTPSIVVDNEEIYNSNVMNYSTSEQRIGTWINGKPIYRKVIEYKQDLPSNNTVTVADVSGLNISMLVNLRGITKHATQSSFRVLPNAGGGTDDIRIDIDNGNLRVRTYSSWSAYTYNMFILEYTKTTD